MDKKQFELEIKGLLKFNKLCVLSTVSSEMKPESSVLLYSSDDEMNLYFITRKSTRKFKNLKVNKNVSAVIGTSLNPSTIQIDGVAELLDEKFDDFISKKIMDPVLIQGYYGPFSKLPGDDSFAVIKVKPTWMRYLHLNENNQEVYHQII